MAARLNPCFGCPLREGCSEREPWAKRISGLGLRSVWFDCPKLGAEVRPGRRIMVAAPVADGWGDNEHVSRKMVKATITAIGPGHAFACVVDPGQITEEDLIGEPSTGVDGVRFWRKRRHSRIAKFLNEPDDKPCKFGNLRRNGKCDYRTDKASQCGCDHAEAMESEAHNYVF